MDDKKIVNTRSIGKILSVKDLDYPAELGSHLWVETESMSFQIKGYFAFNHLNGRYPVPIGKEAQYIEYVGGVAWITSEDYEYDFNGQYRCRLW